MPEDFEYHYIGLWNNHSDIMWKKVLQILNNGGKWSKEHFLSCAFLKSADLDLCTEKFVINPLRFCLSDRLSLLNLDSLDQGRESMLIKLALLFDLSLLLTSSWLGKYWDLPELQKNKEIWIKQSLIYSCST